MRSLPCRRGIQHPQNLMRDLLAPHPYRASPFSWPLLLMLLLCDVCTCPFRTVQVPPTYPMTSLSGNHPLPQHFDLTWRDILTSEVLRLESWHLPSLGRPQGQSLGPSHHFTHSPLLHTFINRSLFLASPWSTQSVLIPLICTLSSAFWKEYEHTSTPKFLFKLALLKRITHTA